MCIWMNKNGKILIKKISESKKNKIIDITLNRTMFEYGKIFFYRILFEPPTTTYAENDEYLRK